MYPLPELTMERVCFLYQDLGFELKVIARFFGVTKEEVHLLVKTHGLRKFAGIYWRLSALLSVEISRHLDLGPVDGTLSPVKVPALLRQLIARAIEQNNLDWSAVHNLAPELSRLAAELGLSERDAERARNARSFGGSFPWLTEQGLRRGRKVVAAGTAHATGVYVD